MKSGQAPIVEPNEGSYKDSRIFFSNNIGRVDLQDLQLSSWQPFGREQDFVLPLAKRNSNSSSWLRIQKSPCGTGGLTWDQECTSPSDWAAATS
eukprot:5113061-Amphidinium_carterae.1